MSCSRIVEAFNRLARDSFDEDTVNTLGGFIADYPDEPDEFSGKLIANLIARQECNIAGWLPPTLYIDEEELDWEDDFCTSLQSKNFNFFE